MAFRTEDFYADRTRLVWREPFAGPDQTRVASALRARIDPTANGRAGIGPRALLSSGARTASGLNTCVTLVAA